MTIRYEYDPDRRLEEVLDCPMQDNDADARQVRDYLVELGRQVWIRGEGFSGKRPFGNSSWEHEVYAALGHAGIIDATFDEYGYLEEFDRARANELILEAFDRLLYASRLNPQGSLSYECPSCGEEVDIRSAEPL